MGTKKIEVRNLKKIYESEEGGNKNVLALEGVQFDIEAEEFVCILGPSGCGKSTILNILAGLDLDFSGEAYIDGRRLGGENEPGNGVQLGFVFQEPRLLPWLSVEKNIYFALENCSLPRNEWERITAKYLDLVGLCGFEKYYPHELSGGMQQRTAIARAFCVDPAILLMDEPFSGLDEITARKLRTELLDIWKQTKKTIIFVTHNSFEATFLADRILIMTRRPGRIYEEVRVDIPKPRDYEDPKLFELNSQIVKRFLKKIGEECEFTGGDE